jgi:hypothetical protein
MGLTWLAKYGVQSGPVSLTKPERAFPPNRATRIDKTNRDQHRAVRPAAALSTDLGTGNAQIESATTKFILRTNELSTQC